MHDSSEGKMITGLRDASFSCYLTTPAEVNSFAAKLTAEPETHHQQTNSRPSVSEIGVFGAEKYFNMRLEGARSPHIIDTITGKYVRESDAVDVRKMRQQKKKSYAAVRSTPSVVSSEASQSALLRGTSLQKRASERSSFFHGFSCRGSCSDEKSIHNNRAVEAARKVQSSRFLHKANLEAEEEAARKSLEVFGSQSMKKEDAIAMDLERKLSVLTWDAIPLPKRQQQTTTTLLMKANTNKAIDVFEAESDASSDLFEIETGSGSTRRAGPLGKQQMDYEGGYAPSEASVEWSVVTASAAHDFSFASECGDEVMRGNSAPKGKKSSSSSGNGILSCKSHKAVEVAETALHKGKRFSSTSASEEQVHTR